MTRTGFAHPMFMVIEAQRANPNYGKGNHRIDDDTPSMGDEERELRNWLDGLFAKPGFELPRPPSAALEIVNLTRRPNAKIEDMAVVLEREPMLAGRVLKLANSAIYGATTPCTSLKQALIRIGVERVRDVVMEAAMLMTVIHAPGFESTLDCIRRHSAAVAWLSRLVARNTPMESENAFLIGLLHDVGLSVGVVGVCEFLRRAKKPSVLTPARWLAVERLHESFSDTMLENWGLPMQVRIVARNHHSLMVGGHPHPSVAILMLAEQLANEAGWGVTPVVKTGIDEMPMVHGAEVSNSHECDRARQVLNITDKQFEVVRAESKKLLTTLAGQFKE